MRKKQITAALLTSVMAASLAFTGCGDAAETTATTNAPATEGQTEKETEAATEKETEADAETEKETAEETAETISSGDVFVNGSIDVYDESDKIGNGETLTIAIPAQSTVTDYKDNYLTKKLEEELNINLEFYELPTTGDDINSKLSLMVTTPETLPDIIITSSLTPETILYYGSNGIFIPLNEYIDNPETAKYFSQIPDEDREHMYQDITSADGNIYTLPYFSIALWNMTPNRYYINQAWLDTLGLEVPTTTDELKEVLKAFVTEDPNGNGVADEIGVYGYFDGGYGQNTIDALMNSFIFYNGGAENGGLSLDETGETVIAPFMTDEWREGLRYLNSLYEEGLIDQGVFTNDDTQFKATLNNETNIVGLTTAGSFSNWTDADNNANFLELEMIPPFTGPEGVCYTPYDDANANPIFFITSNCENPELAFRLGDYFYKHVMSRTGRWGQENVDWTSDPEVCKDYTNGYIEGGLADEITLVSLTNIWSEPSSQFWHNMNPGYESIADSNTNTSAASPYDSDSKSAPLTGVNVELYGDKYPEKVLPLLHYTLDEAEQISQIVSSVSDFVDTTMAEFITGNRDIETGWESYQEEVNSLGLPQWLEAAQAAYDRTKE